MGAKPVGVDHVEEDDNDDIGDTSDAVASVGMSLSGFGLGSLGEF